MPMTYSERVAAIGDSGYSNDNGEFGTNGVNFGQYPNLTGYDWDGFARWDNVGIPCGSIIHSAVITGTAYAETETVRVRIRGNAHDDAVAPTSEAEHDAMARTTAYTDWEITAEWFNDDEIDTADFKTSVQEIIDRPGWDTGNAIMIFFDEYNSYDDIRSFVSYHADPTKAPLLTITYTPPAPTAIIIAAH